MSKLKLRKIQDELDALEARKNELLAERAAAQKTGGGFVRDQDDARIVELDRWQATILLMWQRCCESDGVDPANRFAVFSPGNPIVPYYRIAIGQFKEFLGGNIGYVGMSLPTLGTKGKRVTAST